MLKQIILLGLVNLMYSATLVAEPTGRSIGVTCAACHGEDGISKGRVQNLQTINAKDMEQSLLDFRSGKSKSTIMGRIAKGYSDSEIKSVSVYFAQLAEQAKLVGEKK